MIYASPSHALTSPLFVPQDQVNPPELKILETEVEKIPNGRAIVLPITDKTVGHGTHTVAECWKEYLTELLERSSRKHTAKL